MCSLSLAKQLWDDSYRDTFWFQTAEDIVIDALDGVNRSVSLSGKARLVQMAGIYLDKTSVTNISIATFASLEYIRLIILVKSFIKLQIIPIETL